MVESRLMEKLLSDLMANDLRFYVVRHEHGDHDMPLKEFVAARREDGHAIYAVSEYMNGRAIRKVAVDTAKGSIYDFPFAYTPDEQYEASLDKIYMEEIEGADWKKQVSDIPISETQLV